MRVLPRYVVKDYLVIFLTTVAVFTFIMCLSSLVRVIDMVARGASAGLIFQIFLLNIPFALQFTVPMSALTAALLLVSRLSLDGEITAMRACGISLWQTVSPLLVASVGLSLMTLLLTNYFSPAARYRQRQAVLHLADEDPAALIEAGRFVRDFPNLLIYVGQKDGPRVRDVIIYEVGDRGNRRSIRAVEGTMATDASNRIFKIDLYDVRIEQPDKQHPLDPTQAKVLTAGHYPREIKLDEIFRRGPPRKKISDFLLHDLAAAIRDVRRAFPQLAARDLARQRMSLLVEANTRMALSLSCFAFTLLGIPLGLRSRRRESSIGVSISLGMMFIFYFFMAGAKALVSRPAWHPDLLVWLPVIVAEALGAVLIHRAR